MTDQQDEKLPFSLGTWTWLIDAMASGHARRLRKRIGLTQTSMAAMVGCTSGAIGHWEAGRRRPGLELGMRYARLLLRIEGELDRRATREARR
jgi:DNA-binding XRE family transcriptional regulator